MTVTTCLFGGCALNPEYVVRIDNNSSRTLHASLERRPTINEVIGMDTARIRTNSSRVLGPAEARPLERVYIVIGERTDLHAMPESIELSRGEWIVTIEPGSVTSWGTYELEVRRADEPLIEPESDQNPEDGS
jgi:hypothetical protein